MQKHGDSELVARLRAGDPLALEELVEAFQPRMLRLVHRLLGWSGDAEDLVQDVFVAALENLPRFRGEARLSTWLTAIAVNRCRAHMRWRRLRETALQLMFHRLSAAPNGRPPGHNEIHDEVRRAVRTLRSRYREVVVLRYFEELSNAEVAEVLGISPAAVEQRLSRGRRMLKDRLTTWGTWNE